MKTEAARIAQAAIVGRGSVRGGGGSNGWIGTTSVARR